MPAHFWFLRNVSASWLLLQALIGGAIPNARPTGPVIRSFSATAEPNNCWTFRGIISAPNVTVTLRGLPVLGTGVTTECDGNGDFLIRIIVPAGETGMVTATATDPCGQSSAKCVPVLDAASRRKIEKMINELFKTHMPRWLHPRSWR